MLDIKFIRDNTQLVKQTAANKGVDFNVDRLLELDIERRELITTAESLRQERNDLSGKIKGRPSDEVVQKVKSLKFELEGNELKLEKVNEEYDSLLLKVPNIPSKDTPVGDSEEHNKILRTVGSKPEFGFTPRPHWEMTEFVEQQRAAKISGARFAYIKNGMAKLQMALMLWGMNQLTDPEVIAEIVDGAGLNISKKPFIAVLPPVMMRSKPYQATARLKPEEVTFKLANDDLWLIGSAEHSLCAYYLNDTIEEEMPVRMVGYSPSFRREVGSSGEDTRGILRVHQFNKLEMESFSAAEDSENEHNFMIAIQEYLMKKLGLHYQLVLKCTADMGGPNIRGVDIETWMPGQGKYRETHSADFIGDYQARGLNTKHINSEGERVLVHTNDATALADRTLIAIVENYQLEGGGIRVPEVLRPYVNNKEVL